MKESILIVGAGSLSNTLLRSLESEYALIHFLDDSFSETETNNRTRISKERIIGTTDNSRIYSEKYKYAIAVFGNNLIRTNINERLRNEGFIVPNIVQKNALLASSVNIGYGNIIRDGAIIDEFVTIGNSCLINIGALIDHDCVIKDGTHVKMGAVIRNEKHTQYLSIIEANSVLE